ncbi:TPA: hypothetical protein ACIWEX_002671 [Salmonella enterica subsp. enterica serovar Enteritidis]|uniref:Uncharacterized protein n=2 Tax=Rosemountvirus TaxID=2733127 RepID=A0A140XG57_9CAUD|nr:head protein [Salmonella phage BP63]ATI16156.1 hypothetical protein PA13076_12 [Salmonella phage vB_SenM_PA13076]EAP3072088.1 hypothetical protein [Salmonella enterica]EKN7553643.1 hypothetical protein [Escherichia coli]MDR5453676.1 hypothetical protein [Salmonella enterica subsp. enterica serovar Rissen]QBJ00981.1 hypothetical protein LSE7621_00061 [Salmonella phage LSE7621]QFR58203.1 hypothetical protein [Salmonella phage 8-19]UVT36336.1 hypothetical protein Rostam_gp47c [Salmonella pha
MLKITSLMKDKTFVALTDVLLRNDSRLPNGDFEDEYTAAKYLCNIQPGAATNQPNLLTKDDGEHEFPRIAIYCGQELKLGDFVIYEDQPYRVFRIDPWSRHGHYYVTAILHKGPQGARSEAFNIT